MLVPHQPDFVPRRAGTAGGLEGLKWCGVSPPRDAGDAGAKDSETEQAPETDPAETARRQARGRRWASLMARTFCLMYWRVRGVVAVYASSRSSKSQQCWTGSFGISASRLRFLRRVPPARLHAGWKVSARPVGTARRCPIPVPDNSQQWLAREHAGGALGAGHDLSRLASVGGNDNSARDGPRIRVGSVLNLRCGRGEAGGEAEAPIKPLRLTVAADHPAADRPPNACYRLHAIGRIQP